MTDTFLQIFLGLQVVTVIVLAALAIRYTRAHFRAGEHAVAAPKSADALPGAIKLRLLNASEAKFQTALNRSADKLEKDLQVSAGQINELLKKLANEIVAGEMENYRQELAKLQRQASEDLSGIRSEVTKHEAELKAKMAEELEAEKQRLVKQMDTKLADAVGSFLTETLGHNVDLGNQSEYLVKMLDEHKDELIKRVADEAGTAK